MANLKTISRSDYAQAQKFATKYDISISQAVKFFEDIEELEMATGKQKDAVRTEMFKRLGWASLKPVPVIEEQPAIVEEREEIEDGLPVEHVHRKPNPTQTIEQSAEIETDGVLVGEVAQEIECACGLKFWSLDSDHVQCDACDEAAADFESDVRLNEVLIGTEKTDRTPYMTVTIPSCDEHAGILSRIVTLEWICPTCGGPRGKPCDAVSFDGSLRLYCHGWSNPCGHIDKYEDVRKEADAMIGTEKPIEGRRYDGVVIGTAPDFVLIRCKEFGFTIRIGAGEALSKFLIISDEITFAQNWDWTHNPRAIDIKRKEKPAPINFNSPEMIERLARLNGYPEYKYTKGDCMCGGPRNEYGYCVCKKPTDPRDAEIECLRNELAQAKDERDRLKMQIEQMDRATDNPREEAHQAGYF